ncbi:hypothetical protein HMPREF1318_1056 [Actinomyces massiliensis F0489]|uniref:Uncharacterized protein n=1 Tax=Actinomyces massiliensis F0489 TaxID=1125718 RepID=J0NJR6_9ACTO|nr:hypothetical protein HMPREF1318_1056 [Actinomyces massiliensis F0489]
MTHHNLAPVVPPISSRKRTDLKPEPDRSRAGTGPISTRVTTDLDAEYDRSRRGVRPISAIDTLLPNPVGRQ